MRTDDRRAENGVLARRGQHLDEALRLALGDSAVQPAKLVARDLVGHALRFRLGFVQAHSSDFGIEERHGGDHAVIRLEPLELAKQGIHAGKPGLVTGRMRELERAGDIPRGVNVRKFGREEFIGHHGLGRVDPDILQSVAREARRTAHGDDQRIEGDLDFRATMLGDQLASLDPQRAVSGQHVHSRAFERRLRLERHVGILAPENTIGHFDLRHLRTEPGKRLRQFAPDRPAAQHRDARRGMVHCRKRVPHRVAGQIAAGFQPRDRRDQRTGTRGDHDRARGQPLHAAILARDFDGPWIDHPAVAFDHIDTEPGVAFDAVMRLDCPDRAHHAFDSRAKRHFGFDRFQTISIGMAHLLGNLGALDQRLGRHAASVEAIAPHLVRFD